MLINAVRYYVIINKIIIGGVGYEAYQDYKQG